MLVVRFFVFPWQGQALRDGASAALYEHWISEQEARLKAKEIEQ